MTAQPATIQVQYVNQPKPGKRAGSIRDTNGAYWTVAPEHLQYFSPNQTAEILYDDHGNYQMVVGMGGQLFPKAQQTPQPGSAVAGPPRNASWPAQPQSELTYEKPPADTPPILSNVLAHAISAGVLTRPDELPEWAKWTNEAIKSFHAGMQQRSPGNAARNPDPYPTGDNMERPMTDIPMGDPNDPGYQ